MEDDFKQVTVPLDAAIFDNDVGLAVGFSYAVKDKKVIAMPGVPMEMKAMFENKVLPYLLQEYKVRQKKYLIIRTILMREAELNQKIIKIF